ncbi:MAG: type II toxin-antitoxin system prevent-host-death family antitoxin [Desulforhabdus sp.]|jgi:prevent-host-death family protein|nr:type II toxin-antitoxin system prevent-host-death family antitoxin [Desulforhabdus sp.]
MGKEQAETISSFEAKTHLAQLIQKAEQGASFIITRRGKPVARLVPLEKPAGPDYRKLAREMRDFRSKIQGKIDVLELRDEGRKY